MSTFENAQIIFAQAKEAFEAAKRVEAQRVKAEKQAAKQAAKQWLAEQTAMAKRRKLMTKVAKQAAKKALAKQAAVAKAVAKQRKLFASAAKAAAKAARQASAERAKEAKAMAQRVKAAKRVEAQRVKAAKQAGKALAKQRKLITKAAKAAAKQAKQANAQRVKKAKALTKAAKQAAAFALKDRARRLKAAKALAKHRELMEATDFPSPKSQTFAFAFPAKRKFSGGRDQVQFNELKAEENKKRVARTNLSRQIKRRRVIQAAIADERQEYFTSMDATLPLADDDTELMDLCDDCPAPADCYDHDGQHCHTCGQEAVAAKNRETELSAEVSQLAWNAPLTHAQADHVWDQGF